MEINCLKKYKTNFFIEKNIIKILIVTNSALKQAF